MITHDANGPFVRAARDASAEGQSATVYAVRVEYVDGSVEFWNASDEAESDEAFQKTRQMAYGSRGSGRIRAVERVSRVVTITAAGWATV